MSKLSLAAYRKLVDSGKQIPIDYRVHQYVDAVTHLQGNLGASLDNLRNNLPYPHQTLTGALSRLQDAGMITQMENGNFIAVSESLAKMYAANRKQKRYQKWVNAGTKEGFFELWNNE